MKSKTLFHLSFLLMLSCTKKDGTNPNESKVATIDTSRISIVKYDFSNKYSKRVFPVGINASLNNSDLKKIELVLDEIISKQNPKQIILFDEISKAYPKENYRLQDFIIKKENYVRRYLIIKNKKGEKEIFVSLICDEIAGHLDWRGSINQGYGGGSCLFSFKINFKTNKYYDVWFNAEA